MLKLVICGSPLHPSSHHQDQNHHQDQVPMSQLSRSAGTSPCCTPKKSRKTSFSRSHNNKEKNPYATRGLEKFSALLVDLEEKRQKIYEQSAAAEDISFVRFVYKNSNDLVPIIVKLKDSSQKEAENITNNNKTTTTHTAAAAAANEDLLLVKDQQQSIQNYSSEITHDDKFPMMKEVKNKSQRSEQSSRKVTKKLLLQSWRSMVNLDKLRRPSYYLPVVVIMILILLVFFGRSIAILCTSIGWYVVPTLNDSSSNRKRSSVVHKKDYVKKLSERKMMTEGVSSPRIYNKSGHQRSW